MVRSVSLCGQRFGAISRTSFESLVARHGAERCAKGLSTWSHLVAMRFSQVARAESLRDICSGLACCMGELSDLGVTASPKRSTVPYADIYRPAAVFEETFWTTRGTLRSAGRLGQERPFRFRNYLASLDSTTISLRLSVFEWASYRRAKGGVKLDVLLSREDDLPGDVPSGLEPLPPPCASVVGGISGSAALVRRTEEGPQRKISRGFGGGSAACRRGAERLWAST